MNRMLLAAEWDNFARHVLPPSCSAVQRQEMRRAFYAGAESILFRVIQSFAPEAEPTEADLMLMSDVNQELIDFAAAVKAGKA
jgi:hypothetical protein